VVVRTAATNLVDFFSVDPRLAKPPVMAALAMRNLLQADYGYLLAMLTAGTLSTVLGDYTSHNLLLNHAGGSIALRVLLAPFFIAGDWRGWSLSSIGRPSS
jgi:hypothetical protein